jgi:hypothetical protein
MMRKLFFTPSFRADASNLFLRTVRSDLLHQGGVDV